MSPGTSGTDGPACAAGASATAAPIVTAMAMDFRSGFMASVDRRGVNARQAAGKRGLHVDRHAVGEDVVDHRAGLRALDDLVQLLRRRIALDGERHADPPEAV